MPHHLLTSSPPDPAGDRDSAFTSATAEPSATVTANSAPKPTIPARRWLIALFAVLLVAWVGIAGVGGPYFGKISEVSTNDRSTFLPESAESTKAQELIDQFSDLDYVPAIVVLEDQDGVSKDSTADLEDLAETLDDKGLLAADASPVIPSEDGEALELILPVSTDTAADDVEQIRSIIAGTFPVATADSATGNGNSTPTSADVYVTGPGGFSADLTSAFAGIDGILLLVALIAVFVILIIVYRIFLMSRVREESLHVGTRKGVLEGLMATGGVITSAGIVLAATFAAFAVIPVMFLFQLAFIVTFGVLLDAILVRSLVVPALVHDIGWSIWWPWRKRIPDDVRTPGDGQTASRRAQWK